jgi:hypothetical protein
MNPFDYLNSINHTKQDIIADSDNPELAEKLYIPYMTNKGLSYFIDTVYLANEMNQRHYVDKKLQYHFLLNTIRKKKRFSKWHKPQQDEVVEAVMQYYDYSIDKARQIVDLLSDQQITKIKKSLGKGGKQYDGDNREHGGS